MRKTLLRGTIVLILGLFGQQAGAQQIDSMMAVYEAQYPYEKIHVQFDKEAYNKEETIWYKAYVITGVDLSDVSRNLYVEWYDTTGKMIKQTVAPLYLSSAKGSFELPADYTGNFIQVKAFTRWMLNDDSVFLYERRIPINNSTTAGFKKPAVTYKTRLEIFPEGGFLVKGITSRVAFKASNQYGNPVMFKGILVNNKNVTMDTLLVEHDGMGSFPLTPMEGETYRVNWTDEYGKTGTTDITGVKPEGVCLSIATTNDKAIVQVERSNGVADNFKQFNLLVHMNQKLFFKAALKGADKIIQRANIPIEELPTGILQFSLFTSDWIPVAERVIFINNHTHEFNAKIVPQMTGLDKRAKNVIDIQVSDTAVANMSIAITDAAVPIPEMNTIFSDILISGEIRGKVYNPAYYLTSDADSIAAHLDLLMLTNGWRRFDWDKIKAGIVPKLKYPFETDYMRMQGHVFGLRATGANLPMMNLIVVAKDSTKQLKFLEVEKDGSFRDNNSFFYDTVRIFYSFNDASKLNNTMQVKFDNGLLHPQFKKVEFGLTDPVSRWSDSISRVRMNFFLTQQEALKKAMAAVTLQEVIVKSRAKTEAPMQALDKRYASGLFSGGDGYAFDFTDDPFANSARDVLSYLQGKVAGLTISGSGSSATLSWRGSTPSLFVNEMQADVDRIQTVAVADIAYVKVFRPPFFGAMGGGAGGAIAVYTKKGADGRKSSGNDSKGLENTVLGGYSRFREFYSPVYDKPNEGMESDTRTTLYWNPYIITNKKSPRYRIEFYNNDFSKKLQVVLEGLNSDGKMVRVVRTIE
jgi:hypothetical protein